MCWFMNIKYINPKLTTKQLAKELGYSDSTKNGIELILLGIVPMLNKNFVRHPKETSKDLKWPQKRRLQKILEKVEINL